LIPPAPDLSLENDLWKNQIDLIAGLDEAGRGAWAGPVVAAAVILPRDPSIPVKLAGARDSKQLRPDQRSKLEPLIKQSVLTWGVGFASCQEIDELGILPATRLAMMRALDDLKMKPSHLLIDALFLPEIEISQTSLIKGDQRSLSIAVSSILAKTARDRWMVEYSKQAEAYAFEHNKGYGTRAHLAALERCGPCPQHRRYYAPIKSLMNKRAEEV
jgi:ribonuclease HII